MRANTEWDVVVIGTGPSGATLARDLTMQGKRVLILEKGQRDTSMNIPRMLGNKEMLFMGRGRTLVRGLRTGGSSIFYYGTAYQPPDDVLADYGIDLSDEFSALRKELPIGPLQDSLLGPAAKTIMQSARSLGYAWGKLDKFIYQELCNGQTFPLEAQWNATRYVDEATTNGATLVQGANVKRILTHGNLATAVEYSTDGDMKTVLANTIVIAAGGIGSSQILQQSGLSGTGNGFFCDPLVMVQGEISGIQTGSEIPMATGMIFKEEGFILSDLTLPKIVYQLFTARSLRLHRINDHPKTLAMMVKIKDQIGGTIDVNGKIRKDFTNADRSKMHEGARIARKIMEHAGAKKIYQTAWTSAHPGGSVRIGEMVDANLETKVRNLYVCDCSVIPFDWGMPPTLMVMALAKRLAKHLRYDHRYE